MAGLVLADVLAEYDQGHRPVTLIGYSMGARVIFYALEALAERAEEEEKKRMEERKERAAQRLAEEKSDSVPEKEPEKGGFFSKMKGKVSGVFKSDSEKAAAKKKEREERRIRDEAELETGSESLKGFHSLRGIVLDVYLMGAPVIADPVPWKKVRR